MPKSTYTPDEIERKRLLALQRKQLKTPGGSNLNSSVLPASVAKESPKSSLKQYQFERRRSRTPAKSRISPKRVDPLLSKPPSNFFGQSSASTPTTGTCYMITEERFAIDLSAFHEQVVQIFRTIASAIYDIKTKIWNFHLSHYEMLMNKVIDMKPHVVINGLPRFVIQTFRRHSEENNASIDLSPIDPILLETLMPFQTDGVAFGIAKNGRCIIADDMGLGKTIQALGIAHYYKNDWPLLIVSPSSVRYQWSEAIYNFLPSVPIQHINLFTNGKDVIGDSPIVIISYDLLSRNIDSFEKHIFGVIILDESHFLKSIKSARTQAVTRMVAQSRRTILLSGTPALSRPIELFTQINLVVPRFMGFHDYGRRYCAGVKTKFAWDFNGSSNMQELQLLLRKCCLIRRLKTQVLSQLPSKIRQVVVLDPALIKAATKEMNEISQKLQESTLNGSEKHTTLLQYYSETSKAKVKAICNYITDMLESDRKFLVFAHHQVVIDGLCQLMESKKEKYIVIDGKTKARDRKDNVDLFQEQDDYRVAILSIVAANAGLNLTAAHLVIFAELFWNPGILCQAEDRVHRIGQDSSVVIQYLVAKKTADDYLWPLIKEKLHVLNSAGLTHDFSLVNVPKSAQKDSNQTKMDSHVSFIKSSPNESCTSDDQATDGNDVKSSNISINDHPESYLSWNNTSKTVCSSRYKQTTFDTNSHTSQSCYSAISKTDKVAESSQSSNDDMDFQQLLDIDDDDLNMLDLDMIT